VTVELLGIGKGTFDCLLAALVDSFAPRGEPMRPDSVDSATAKQAARSFAQAEQTALESEINAAYSLSLRQSQTRSP
jgi:hypothetical protein